MLMMLRASQDKSDDALIADAAARDGDAFRVLIDRHGARPYRLAWRMLNDPIEAEDVAQEALLRLWDKAGEWRAGEAGVAAWLVRVATNLCLDRLRRRKFSSDEEVPERVDDAPLADALIEEDQAKARAIAAVQSLPERQRAAIVLTYYEDVSNQMAAQMLDMNIKAFESLLLRARAALREALADLNGEFS